MQILPLPSPITLILAGTLGDELGREFKIQANRLNEVVSYCFHQIDGFHLVAERLDRAGSRVQIQVQQGDSKFCIDDPGWLDVEILPHAIVTIADIPAAGGDTATKILAGVGFLAFAALVPGGVLGIAASSFGMYGAGLILGGINNWLAPKPKSVRPSAIAGISSEKIEGKPIPVVYGRSWVTPTVISSGSKITPDNQIITSGGIGAAYWEQYRSTATMQVIDALCEGQIKGFATTPPENSMWLNGIPLRNSDGFQNYIGVNNIYWQVGYIGQPPHPAPWNAVSREVEVNQPVKASAPVIRRINEPNVSKIAIRLYWQQLIHNNNSTQSKWKIWIKEGSGAWVLREQNQIDGKSDGYEYQTTFTVGQAPYYEVKIERNQPDPNPLDTTQLNTAIWRSYTAIWDVQMRYQYTATIAWEFEVAKFGTNQITRKYLVDGTICAIPTNATVRADGSLAYSGTWNGLFQYQWTSCPIWCLYNLLLNDRFGLNVPFALVDRFAFYSASVYANQLISDGFGGTEPRFTLNCTITTRSEAFDLIKQICAVFNAMAYYAPGGSFIPVLDRPQSVTAQFSNSNATFSYATTASRLRHNRVSVSWQNLAAPDTYEREIWEDDTLISRDGANYNRSEGFGIASRGQAKRAANWLGYTAQQQIESITIQTGLEGAAIRPGQVVQVSDWLKTLDRLSGRIAAATSTSVTLDQPIALPLGNHTLWVSLSDGTLAQRTISTIGATQQTWTLTTSFTTLPNPEASWIIGTPTNPPTQWRVVSVTERELHKYEIIAISHDPNKWSLVEQFDFTLPPDIPSPPAPPLSPSNLIATQSGNNINLSWSPPTPATYTVSYQIQWQNTTLTPQSLTSSVTTALITGIQPDSYSIKVRAVDTTGATSGWISTTIQLNAQWTWATVNV